MQLIVQSRFLSPQAMMHAGAKFPFWKQPKLQNVANITQTARQSSDSLIPAASEFTVRCVERRRAIKTIQFMYEPIAQSLVLC